MVNLISKVDLSKVEVVEETVAPVGAICKIIIGAFCGIACGGAGCGGWCGGAACAGW